MGQEKAVVAVVDRYEWVGHLGYWTRYILLIPWQGRVPSAAACCLPRKVTPAEAQVRATTLRL